MNGVENYQKANQNLFHMDGVLLYLIELFSKIADRLVFCMFDIKLLIFTRSQDILLIFSQRQKKLPWPDSNKIHSEVRNLTALNLVSF